MNKSNVINIISSKLKLIRVESGYNQSDMANILGLSKKTLVEIEKGRKEASWTVVVAICALFRDSDIIMSALGEKPLEFLETLAHGKIEKPKNPTMGGKIWWENIDEQKNFRLQKNIVSGHYRILDENNWRWYSTLEEDEAIERFKLLILNKE